MTVGDRIATARKHKKLTQKALGKLACISQKAISKTERNKTDRPRNLDKIAYALEVPEEWLAFGINPPDWTAGSAIKEPTKDYNGAATKTTSETEDRLLALFRGQSNEMQTLIIQAVEIMIKSNTAAKDKEITDDYHGRPQNKIA